MSTQTLMSLVREYLASQYMYVDNEWLEGCVEFLKEESGSDYNETELKNLAKEQWLLNDLKDICPGCLPANLKGKTKTVLNGRFVLQINGAVDIGTPAYQQYLKIQKVNTENVEVTTNFEDKIPSHRMMKLYLTDGVQEITAIEYKPMRNLSCDITPGCKVLLKGPIDCRRGMLLLTENCVSLLGGEVQEIAVSHSHIGLVSSKLGLPITYQTNQNTLHHRHNSDIPAPITGIPPATYNETASVTNHQSTTQTNNFDDDIDIDIDQIAAIEAQISDNTPTKRPLTDNISVPDKKAKIDPVLSAHRVEIATNSLPTNNPKDCLDDDDMFIEDEEYIRELEQRFDAEENQVEQNKCPNTVPLQSNDTFVNDEYMVELDNNFETEENIHKTNRNPIAVPPEPFVYIKQICDMEDGEKTGKVFKVKGQILKLLSKLSVGKDGWSLKCTIVDGTGSLDVAFTSDVLSKLVGFTPQEMNHISKQMAVMPELKAKAVAALQKAKNSLEVLYCIIELTMLEVPKITCLTPVTEAHVDMLRKRVCDSGL